MPKLEHDETKLPKYAQQELRRLRQDLARAKAALTAGPEDSNTFADPYIDPRPLGRSETIEFRLNTGIKIRCRIEQGSIGEYLDINADTSIQVLPTASNAIRVRS